VKSRKLIISIVLTGLILFFIFYFIDFDTFVASLKKVRISYLFLVFLVQLLIYLARAARFEIILQRKGLLIYFSISSVHFFLNKVLPARTGELSMPILFNRYLNISYKKGIGALFIFRFLDLISVVFLLAISLFFVRIEELNHYLLIMFAAIIITLQILFWIKLKLFINLLERILKRIKIKKIEKHKEKLFEYFQQIITYKESRTSGFLLKLILISLFTWLLTYLGYFLIISSFNLDYSIMQVIFATSLANFTFLIPISAIGGFGTFEAGWAVGFVLLGMPMEMAVPVGLFTNVFGLIMTGIIASIGYIYLLFYLKKRL
jgi:uncharacterized protein (TIRG00374 family)